MMDGNPMKRSALTACVAGFALFAGSASAQTRATQCDIVMQSQSGGMVEVTTTAQLAAPPRIVWRPTPSNGRIELLVAFEGTLDNIGEPRGVLIRFPLEANDLPEGIAVNVQSGNGRTWRFTGQTRDEGGETGHIEFDDKLVYGRALLGAIADGQRLTISAQRYDRTVGATMFGLENLRARDALLAQAKRKFDAADPSVCTRG
jgi:hypothetical protein